MSSKEKFIRISGRKDGIRIESRVLEEQIQAAVEQGFRFIEVEAFGQHGIGGRLWKAGDEEVYIRVTGHPGQRLGSMGFPNTTIEVMGPVSDDVGWLNAGAKIIIHGNTASGAANAMAQGRIYVAGNIGARGMTMTKHNPRFAPPELWVLGSAGDYFGEFMAGGIAVICGFEPQIKDNVLGYRPLVGMVGGEVFFRGPYKGFSRADAKMVEIDDEKWAWLENGLKGFLEAIDRKDLETILLDRSAWQLLAAKKPNEKTGVSRIPMDEFKKEVWDAELGPGGMVGDLLEPEEVPIPIITTGKLRRFVPVWENRKYAPPCQDACPTGIPVHDRWRLVREGRFKEAVDMALNYTPFPASVCGYLCPNLCMEACTRQQAMMPSVDITRLGRASIEAKPPEFPEPSGKKVAVIGGGPAGISLAWQLRRAGHEAVIYDMSEELGGKLSAVIPESRIPKEVLSAELERVKKQIPHVHLKKCLSAEDMERLKKEFDIIVIAAGAQAPRILPVPGKERMIPANTFLMKAKDGAIDPGKKVVIIGAGNVGCDVATEAHRLGAESITLIDVQKPAAFGKEKEHAEAVGAKFRWPCFTREVTQEGVILDTGEQLPADTVVISIGDAPETDFLPDTVEVFRGFVKVNDIYQTTDPDIFAIGDVVRPGLLTDAIGAGRKAAAAIIDILDGKISAKDLAKVFADKKKQYFESALSEFTDPPPVIDRGRVHLEYYDPRKIELSGLEEWSAVCASCGSCRDCGICVEICPQVAISRKEEKDGSFAYVVDENRCIGCGFCAGACPCGVWAIVPNDPL